MKYSNLLARLFDWIGEVFERFNPAAFRFLAAVLPYLTPIPVAWLTMKSSAQFLNFTDNIAFVFVFCLEGIGLWFTTLLVDSIVDWVRSRNWKSAMPIFMFACAEVAYIYILVNLNVTLEAASGSVNPALSRVITLLCFLPLITGIGNGYYKLKLNHETAMTNNETYNRELQDRIRQEDNDLKLKKALIKKGINPLVASPQQNQQVIAQVKTRGPKHASDYHDEIWALFDEYYAQNNEVPSIVQITNKLKLEYKKASGYVHGQRKLWLAQKGLGD